MSVRRTENVLFVVIDALRADHLSCYGYPLKTSPCIDMWADFSNQFLYCTGHARTVHAVATLETGRRHLETNDRCPEILQSPRLSDVFSGYDRWLVTNNGNVEMLLKDAWDAHWQHEETALWLTNEALRLKRRTESRWFGIVWYSDVHAYAAFDPLTRSFEEDTDKKYPKQLEWGQMVRLYRYDLAIRHVDIELRRLLNEVDHSNTMVVITSDHGERLLPDFHHVGAMSYEIGHVPLIIALPGQSPMNRAFTNPVSWLDLPPTIADVCGMEIPDKWDGNSLYPLMTREFHDKVKKRLEDLGYL